MVKKLFVAAVLAVLAAEGIIAFSCTPAPGSPSNAKILLYINNDTGCNVVATLDSGNPVTETASGGPYVIYSNVTIGHHTVGISGPNASSACNFDVDGSNQTVTSNNPCSALNGNSGFVLSCS